MEDSSFRLSHPIGSKDRILVIKYQKNDILLLITSFIFFYHEFRIFCYHREGPVCFLAEFEADLFVDRLRRVDSIFKFNSEPISGAGSIEGEGQVSNSQV